jgi:uncharacterized membrane protein (DUF106 family)
VIRSDMTEAWANAIVGLCLSVALVWLLRWAELWDASAWLISGMFFAASVARSYVLRRVFRRLS